MNLGQRRDMLKCTQRNLNDTNTAATNSLKLCNLKEYLEIWFMFFIIPPAGFVGGLVINSSTVLTGVDYQLTFGA